MTFPERKPLEARYKLVGTSGQFAGCEFGIGPGIHAIGRHSSNEVVLPGDGSISRNHARVTVTSTSVTLEDLKSTNGTYINGQKISRKPVKEGDVLQFGDATFTLQRAVGSSTPALGRACPEGGCTGRIGATGICSTCGKRPRSCPRCGGLNTAEARFCSVDGAVLGPAPLASTEAGPEGATRTLLPANPPAAHPLVSSPVHQPTPPRPTPQQAHLGEYPQCPQCHANVGSQAGLCPRCHSRVQRCPMGHISPPTARHCAYCDKPLLPSAERWGVFRGAGSNGWTPEAVRPPLRLAWKFRPPEGIVRWTSPVLGASVAFAGASDGFLYAVQDGVALWRSPLDGPVRTDFVPETCVPSYEDGIVFIGHMGGAVAAIEAITGTPIWQRGLKGLPSGPIRTALGCLFVGVTVSPSEGAVCALGQDGRDIWRYITDSPVYACPAYSAGAIIITTAGGGVMALRASAEVEGDRLIWSHIEQGDEFDTSVAVSRDGVYATSHAGKMLCLDPATGEVLRRWLSPTGNFAHSSPAAGSGGADGQIYFGADDRNVYVVSAQTAQTIVAHPTGGVVLGSPAISDDIAYIGSQDGSLYAIGPGCQHIQAAYTLPTGVHIASSPAVGGGQVVFAGSDGYLYALEACPG